MRSQKNQLRGKEDKMMIKKLNYRLSLQNIRHQFDLIGNMNRNLEISVQAVCNIDMLRHLSKEEVVRLVSNVSFLHHVKATHFVPEHFRLEYENGGKIVLVTGIQREFIETFLDNFNSSPKRISELYNHKGPFAKIVHDNRFWLCVETANEEVASALKKYLRNQKRNMDESHQKEYRIDKRRTRIIIVKEDIFTLLIDAMTEVKAEEFSKNFRPIPPVEKRKSQQNSILPANLAEQKKSIIIYRPLPNIYTNSQNYQYRTDQREEELSDGFSESTSLNSDLFDPSKIKDIIETSDQGIQSESNIPMSSKEHDVGVYSIGMTHGSVSDKVITDKKSQEEIKTEEEKEIKYEQEAIKKNQILRCESEDYGLDFSQKVGNSPKKPIEVEDKDDKQDLVKEEEQKVETIPFKNIEVPPKVPKQKHKKSIKKVEGLTQTSEQLYTALPIYLMKKCIQEFKNKERGHMIQLPDWLKSETEKERNRHRFFSSLCRPKIIHRRGPLW